jgi:hypothetical protein
MGEASDWNLPFHERYLATADAITRLDHWLATIGMSGNTDFERLKSAFIRHGGVTFNDIERDKRAAAQRDMQEVGG